MTTDPVQLLIDAGAIPSSPFGPDSRYHGVPLGRHLRGPGDPGVAYVLRRFVPRRRDIAIVAEHIVAGGERPELLAAQTLGDAELYWRLADANAVIDPFELTDTLGRRVAIPLPPGA
ncbi:MAG TPA: Base plate wedge protein 53 [Ottowia sp.]|mgnify:CR=1 FL=1|uniref:Base plate wedge protein 53 n=1 Tax=Ottowia sp. TaxID=1898956 RepID=UPI002C0F8A90|nr:Base plate wedge protein 53 [Ottowia sp.]HMN20303.1 Base plate wedge protein 53 [Ottowia sp.]